MLFHRFVTELFSSAGFSQEADALPKTYDPVGTESRWQGVATELDRDPRVKETLKEYHSPRKVFV